MTNPSIRNVSVSLISCLRSQASRKDEEIRAADGVCPCEMDLEFPITARTGLCRCASDCPFAVRGVTSMPIITPPPQRSPPPPPPHHKLSSSPPPSQETGNAEETGVCRHAVSARGSPSRRYTWTTRPKVYLLERETPPPQSKLHRRHGAFLDTASARVLITKPPLVPHQHRPSPGRSGSFPTYLTPFRTPPSNDNGAAAWTKRVLTGPSTSAQTSLPSARNGVSPCNRPTNCKAQARRPASHTLFGALEPPLPLPSEHPPPPPLPNLRRYRRS